MLLGEVSVSFRSLIKISGRNLPSMFSTVDSIVKHAGLLMVLVLWVHKWGRGLTKYKPRSINLSPLPSVRGTFSSVVGT